MRTLSLAAIALLFVTAGCDQSSPPVVEAGAPERNEPMNQPEKIVKSANEWQALLTPDQCYVLRDKGTEAPFSNEFKNAKEGDVFLCAACDLPLFEAKHKFESGTGWPSFFQPIGSNVTEKIDNSHGMTRTEILCARCDGHLGHIFKDGPAPTGLRYCTNGLAMKLASRPEQAAK